MPTDREHEVRQLLRFTCERLARSMLGKASASRIRIVARKIEGAALEQAEIDAAINQALRGKR